MYRVDKIYLKFGVRPLLPITRDLRFIYKKKIRLSTISTKLLIAITKKIAPQEKHNY